MKRTLLFPMVLIGVAVVSLFLVSCKLSSIPPVQYDHSLDNESQQLFGIYKKHGVCQNGGYYYIAVIDKEGVYRLDPNGGYYRLTDNGYYHSLQAIGNYVYALEVGAWGGNKYGISRISMNGDSVEKLLDDTYIGRYVVYQNTIYFTQLQDGVSDGTVYAYTDGELTELPITGADYFYIYDGSLFYSNMQAVYKYDSVTRTSEMQIKLPENTDQWLPIENGFAVVIEDEGTNSVVYIENNCQPVEFFTASNDSIVDFGILKNCVFVRASSSNVLHLFNVNTQETTKQLISKDVYDVITNGDQLIVCVYEDNEEKLIVEKEIP